MSRNPVDYLRELVAVVMGAFALFFFLDDRHAHNEELLRSDVKTIERVMMSESTRYAEIVKFYTDKMQSGEPLTYAESLRLDLAQRQQERIAMALKGDSQ